MRRHCFRPQLEVLEPIIAISGTVAIIQIQVAEPIVHISALAVVAGIGARAENFVSIHENVRFAPETQRVQKAPAQGGSVALQTSQTEIADPTVNLTLFASASGTDALAINIVIVDINIIFARQSQMVTRGGGNPASGVAPALISETVSQTEISDPVTTVNASSVASGAHAVSINRIVVIDTIIMSPQTDSVIAGGYGRLSSTQEKLQLDNPILIVSPDVIVGSVRSR